MMHGPGARCSSASRPNDFESIQRGTVAEPKVVESVALNRVSSALRAVLQLQAVHTVHLVEGKAVPVSELKLRQENNRKHQTGFLLVLKLWCTACL